MTWNVNGIRAVAKKGLEEFVRVQRADFLCLQETKAHPEQVEPNLRTLGYPQAFWASAEKKGYSGVATFCSEKPLRVELGLGQPEYDREGRIVRTWHPKFVLYNIYFPNGGSGEERHQFKQRFLRDLNRHLEKELSTGQEIVLVGDYNVAHREIDVYDPVRLANESGFLPEEREWFSSFLRLGFVDCFRERYPQAAHRYTWWSYRELARISNRGWRIDYICTTRGIYNKLKKIDILDKVEGSDHCPVVAEFELGGR
ncbi:MAG: exodeoxyribonuclease III [Bdellovibrionaceae bacterium]|nr:exodeoxyribonuclease III [Pseudobdellovibrionaceae bacterium]